MAYAAATGILPSLASTELFDASGRWWLLNLVKGWHEQVGVDLIDTEALVRDGAGNLGRKTAVRRRR